MYKFLLKRTWCMYKCLQILEIFAKIPLDSSKVAPKYLWSKLSHFLFDKHVFVKYRNISRNLYIHYVRLSRNMYIPYVRLSRNLYIHYVRLRPTLFLFLETFIILLFVDKTH